MPFSIHRQFTVVLVAGWVWSAMGGTLIAADDAAVRLILVDGRELSATNLRVSRERVEFVGDPGTPQTLSRDQIDHLQWPGDPPDPGAVPRVWLRDGSTVVVRDVELRGSRITLTSRRVAPVQMDVREVRGVQWTRNGDDAHARWLGMLGDASTDDRLVIRRGGEQMETIAGLITGVTSTSVAFEIDGQSINAPTDKLVGIVWAGPPASEGDGDELRDRHGSRWRGRLRSIDADEIRFETSFGDVAIPVGIAKRLNLSGSSVPLADLEPVVATVGASFLGGFDDAVVTKVLTRQTPSDWIHPTDTVLEYRIPDGISRLFGTATIDGLPSAEVSVVVRIVLDGDVAWEQTVTRATPRGIDLELGDARRVRIEIQSADAAAAGGRVKMRRLRFVR